MAILDKINPGDTLSAIINKLKNNEKEKEKDKTSNPQDILNVKSFLNGNSKNKAKVSDIKVIDADWIGNSFMTKTEDLPDYAKSRRFDSSAKAKFTNTGWGGNVGINPRPQFTSYADIPATSRYTLKNDVTLNVRSRAGTNTGMGRYYSEAIDDNQQLIFMEFGLPEFNSVLDFFLRAVDYQDSVLANSGRTTTFYNLGSFAGALVMLAAFPIVTIAVWTIKAVSSLLTSSTVFSYYYMKPQMWMYWSTVNNIASQLAVELGLLVPEFLPETPAEPGQVRAGKGVKLNQQWIDDIKELIPEGVIGDNNYIDVFAIATRAQSIALEQAKNSYDLLKVEISIDDYVKKQDGFFKSIAAGLNRDFTLSGHTTDKYLGAVMEGIKKDGPADSKQTAKKAELTAVEKEKALKELKDKATNHTRDDKGGYTETISNYLSEKFSNFGDSFDASVRQGGAFATFYVDYTASVSESFSSSVSQIETAGTIKQISTKSRSLKFDLGGGNVLPGMGDVLGAVKDFAVGGLNSISFGLGNVLQTFLGGAYIELPKKWDDSSMTFPSVTYNMQLRSPYGNVISQLQNLYLPISMLLAGTLPLATGKSSYTSPYLCSLFSKGIQNVKMGMITSLTITRGVSNLGFDSSRRPLAIDVSFQVTDFSTLYTSPVNTSIFSSRFLFSTDDDTPFGNYLTVLGGRDLLTNKYAAHKLKIRLSKRSAILQQGISGHSAGMQAGNVFETVLGPLVSVNSLVASKSSSN